MRIWLPSPAAPFLTRHFCFISRSSLSEKLPSSSAAEIWNGARFSSLSTATNKPAKLSFRGAAFASKNPGVPGKRRCCGCERCEESAALLPRESQQWPSFLPFVVKLNILTTKDTKEHEESRRSKMFRHNFAVLFLLLLATPRLFAAEENLKNRGICVREANLYHAPDLNRERLDTVGRGREIAILEPVNGWLHVVASVPRHRDTPGWMLDKGIIRQSTPNGDQ